ncbi:hypothetical protein [Microvirga arsenatis]|uniref:Helix-turn-helix domain-containing protein n=1 Tax=Microvirga arsenatis TaxID=2692265 RepID=A0ABW9Z6A5_9HYPH|nr:hypothetical protein [Microvirga arsenatis]NBJ12388.1 hypothetical protein [Microvirga arsenatis]NBJ26179.1 hypothetical protein [Microvirga arsenatis]
MNRVWTEEELDILRRDREAKVPVPVTAAKLGRPVPATYARARLIGTLVQPHQSWDEASVARLRELVSSDPPMTDKRIAAALGRTVTQIRWKMQDLGLIGVRDLSKLAKLTAAESGRSKSSKPKSSKAPPVQPSPEGAAARPVVQREPARNQTPQTPQPAAAISPAAAPVLDPQAALERTIRALEVQLAERLKALVAESEAGMVRAARAAIAEKERIDQRLVIRVKRSAEAEARRVAAAQQAEAEKKRIAAEAKRREAEDRRAQAQAKRRAEEPVRQVGEQDLKGGLQPPQSAAGRPAAPGRTNPVANAPSQNAFPQPAAPRIVVSDAPAAVRPVESDPTALQISGRGGWKSVRRDPARVLAQAKAKAKPANRADAVDLAQAAQAAIERFIAERGVTRTETSGSQAIVSRLQARGYIVVRDDKGWIIDQRHRVESESALVAFAEARGITLSAAA